MTRPYRLVPATAALALAIMVLSCLGLLATGCSGEIATPAALGDALQPGLTVSIDLDGDSDDERISIDAADHRLTIVDGPVVYRSREKWWVAAACLGDTTGDGLPEIVALLDAEDGRHLGLFGFASAETGTTYRELLVTAVLHPRPVALELADAGDDSRKHTSELLILTEESGTGTQNITYRWNGFGFTALEPSTP